jgi:hypothetical protein
VGARQGFPQHTGRLHLQHAAQEYSPAADFRFVNVALWRSEQAFREATAQPEFRNATVPFPFHASLYEVVRRDEQ